MLFRSEVLCKFVCHNICCLIQEQQELGIETVFWKDEPKPAPAPAMPLVPVEVLPPDSADNLWAAMEFI